MRKFHRTQGRKRSFLKILAHNLIMKDKIETTEARAKELRPIVERLVTIAKKQTLASFRLLLSKVSKDSAEKLYYEIAPRYKDRKGGYLRILKTSKQRMRDAAKMSIIEFI
ncbi:MAG: 50S ribosomal protein L17 [Patescibacteria group bacterium]